MKASMPRVDGFIEYDIWTLTCMMCDADLALPGGARPHAGVIAEHMRNEHGISYRDCQPQRDGYTYERTEYEDGTFRVVSASMHATDYGRGTPVLSAVRVFGTEKP